MSGTEWETHRHIERTTGERHIAKRDTETDIQTEMSER